MLECQTLYYWYIYPALKVIFKKSFIEGFAPPHPQLRSYWHSTVSENSSQSSLRIWPLGGWQYSSGWYHIHEYIHEKYMLNSIGYKKTNRGSSEELKATLSSPIINEHVTLGKMRYLWRLPLSGNAWPGSLSIEGSGARVYKFGDLHFCGYCGWPLSGTAAPIRLCSVQKALGTQRMHGVTEDALSVLLPSHTSPFGNS